MRYLIIFIWTFFSTITFAQVDQKNKLSVIVDERIELLTTIQLLSDYPPNLLAHGNLIYKAEVRNTFGKYKNHEVIKLFKTMSEGWFAYDSPVTFIIHHQLPNFDKICDFDPEDIEIYGYENKKDTLNLFLSLLKDFYKESNFHQFFKANKSFYDSIINPIAEELKRKDYIGTIEEYYGQKNLAYQIILSPIQGSCGYGPMLSTKNGKIYYAVVGPEFDSKDFPIFDKENIFQDLVIHEFSHSFCNPLVDKFYSQLEKDSCLLKPILKSQQNQGYGEWKTCLYEHLTRANEVVLNNIIYGDIASIKVYKQYVENTNWIYLKGLVPLMQHEYFKNRQIYKTQEALMPKVVEYFDNEMKTCP